MTTGQMHDFYKRGYAPKAITAYNVKQCNIWLVRHDGHLYLKIRFPDGYIEKDKVPPDTQWDLLYEELYKHNRWTMVQGWNIPHLSKFLVDLRLAERTPRLLTFTMAHLWKWEEEYGVLFHMFVRFVVKERKDWDT
jgi:hypothetical protein